MCLYNAPVNFNPTPAPPPQIQGRTRDSGGSVPYFALTGDLTVPGQLGGFVWKNSFMADFKINLRFAEDKETSKRVVTFSH